METTIACPTPYGTMVFHVLPYYQGRAPWATVCVSLNDFERTLDLPSAHDVGALRARCYAGVPVLLRQYCAMKSRPRDARPEIALSTIDTALATGDVGLLVPSLGSRRKAHLVGRPALRL